MKKVRWITGLSCAAAFVLFALLYMLNLSLQQTDTDGFLQLCSFHSVTLTFENESGARYTAQLPAAGEGWSLFFKNGIPSGIWMGGKSLTGMANRYPAVIELPPLYKKADLLLCMGQEPVVYLARTADLAALLRLRDILLWTGLAFIFLLFFYTASLYWFKRSEKYLLSFLIYLGIWLLWNISLMIPPFFPLPLSTGWILFWTMTLVTLRFCSQLCPPRPGGWLHRFLRFPWLFVWMAVGALCQPPNRVLWVLVISFFLFCGLYLLARLKAAETKGVLPLLAGLVILTGMRPLLMIFDATSLERYESLVFLILRQTRIYELPFVLGCMYFVNRRFASHFQESEQLAKHLEERVEKRTAQITEMQRQRQSMMLNIFHDLRSPLFVMRGAIELLEVNPAAIQEMLPILKERNQFVSRLTEELFLAAKLEDGQIDLACCRVDLSNLVVRLCSSLKTEADKEQIHLAVQVCPAAVIWGEPLRLEQILQNLLTNALHYTPQGGLVQVKLKKAGGWAEVSVKDNGKGISAADLPHIFDRYFHTDSGNKHQSSGLGLTIAKELTKLHRGELTCCSEEGRGTKFIASFPLLSENEEEAEA